MEIMDGIDDENTFLLDDELHSDTDTDTYISSNYLDYWIGKNTQLEFRLDFIDHVIEKYHSGLNFHRGRPSSEPNPLRLTERHFLEIIAPTDKKLRPARQ
ncbi:piggyBac transposable element-derived protein 4 [Trichonephila clavipes]|nr:piggyBac transposable element-derived protein 4 [Trichonephila clavipes]